MTTDSRDLQGNVKCTNIWIIGVTEETEKEQESGKMLEEITVRCFPNTGGKEIASQIKEVQTMTYSAKEKHSKTHINQTNKN